MSHGHFARFGHKRGAEIIHKPVTKHIHENHHQPHETKIRPNRTRGHAWSSALRRDRPRKRRTSLFSFVPPYCRACDWRIFWTRTITSRRAEGPREAAATAFGQGSVR